MSRKIIVIAGEASGDVLGADLLTRLQKIYPDAQFSGVGGAEMMAACPSFHSIFNMDDIAVMGLAEVLPSLPVIFNRMRNAKAHIIAQQAELVITIDAPDFNIRTVRSIKAQCPHTKFVHYVAPSVWAWRPKRAEKLARIYDGLLCLLPFEPPYFEPHGLKTLYVGHPALNRVGNLLTEDERQNIRAHYSTHAPQCDYISVLFGSRRGEINRHADILIEAMSIIRRQRPQSLFFIPAFERFKPLIKAKLTEAGFKENDVFFIASETRYDLFKMSDYALAVSGTAGLELALAGAPHSICYRFGALTAIIARRLVKTRYAHLGNIIMDKPLIPEFIQEDCRAELLAHDALDALDQNRRQSKSFKEDIKHLRQALHVSDLDRKMEEFFQALAKEKRP